ncbi:cysteine hydrolase family protein [Parasediminibacterium paludis]|uniref:Cysteine hydrolase family protein n=1 Tax=Parasediminibacterium paludis TaxID=908966 RepID=A0ABV8PVU3_9BACT
MYRKLLIFLITMATLSTTVFGQSQTKKALLILDIQNDFTGSKARMPMDSTQTHQMIHQLNNLVSHLPASAYEIIYIGNEFSKYDWLNIFRNFAAIKGTTGTKQDSRLKIVSGNYFPKNKENAFTNPALTAFLQSKSITELFISGLKAEACVYSTTKGAIKNGYKVTVLIDCIATTSNKKRERMLQKYLKVGAYNLNSTTLIN